METKQLNGQFYTTNSDYILQNLQIPENTKLIVEPFTGTGELVEYINRRFPGKHYELYDIEPKYTKQPVETRDTLLFPPVYAGKYVVTNPPYLARNKNKNKHVYDKFKVNDLYKCFIRCLINDPCDGGIVIIPLNFWSSIRTTDNELRKDFHFIYEVTRVNVFEERVFDDTSYTVCSFAFTKKIAPCQNKQDIPFSFYPAKVTLNISLDEPSWTIGQEIYRDSINSNFKVKRWIIGDENAHPNTMINFYSLDDGKNNGKRIRLEISDESFRGKHSDRTKATLIIFPHVDIHTQRYLVKTFNSYIEEQRKKYNSMFLCNFRESIDYARKRMGFDLAYTIVKRILNDMHSQEHSQ